MRLVAFTWIDAFLTAFDGDAEGDLVKRLAKLREQILLPHVWFTWRHRSLVPPPVITCWARSADWRWR